MIVAVGSEVKVRDPNSLPDQLATDRSRRNHL
jgi:hypothetical protein